MVFSLRHVASHSCVYTWLLAALRQQTLLCLEKVKVSYCGHKREANSYLYAIYCNRVKILIYFSEKPRKNIAGISYLPCHRHMFLSDLSCFGLI